LTKEHFPELLYEVKDFLETRKGNTFMARLANLKALRPISCSKSDTIEDVVKLMALNRVHRVWIVDEQGKPTGVVSMTDMFPVFSPWFL
jgi:CBS domain-containing protein